VKWFVFPISTGGEMLSLAYCGLNCEECPVFQATRNRDEVHKRWLAAEYSSEQLCFSTRDMTCYGCHSQQRLESRMCQGCQLRACASSRLVENCAHCRDFPCNLIERFVPIETDARTALELERERILVKA
jgi:hypothetical protein